MSPYGSVVWVCISWAAFAACSITGGTDADTMRDGSPESPDLADGQDVTSDLAASDIRGTGWSFVPSNVPVEVLVDEMAEESRDWAR